MSGPIACAPTSTKYTYVRTYVHIHTVSKLRKGLNYIIFTWRSNSYLSIPSVFFLCHSTRDAIYPFEEILAIKARVVCKSIVKLS